MIEILLGILIVIALVNLGLTLIKKPNNLEGVTELERTIRDEFTRNREENNKAFKENREELSNSFKNLSDSIIATLKGNEEKTEKLTKSLDERINILQENLSRSLKDNRTELTTSLELIRKTVEEKLGKLQEENTKKLEEMRVTVDEKLQASVEKRFNESFKLINERLEQVHKGLGEMQTLASGVGDLKRVLTNVKTRGTLGEIQLGSILEEIFSPEQFERNATVKAGSAERVEYAIKLPGKNDDNKSLFLPIDSKFPSEDYQRLVDAYDNIANLDPKEIETALKQFENAVKKNAKDIRDKYINPPSTTDFAIMFVPTEGLYAEILRRTGLFETLQRDFKVTVVGPTNLVAFLSSLQMGFRTLAVEKRSSEVWEILGAIKTQFSDFGKILEKTKKKLQEASNVIDDAGVRSRVIERKLKTVQELPKENAAALLGESLEIMEGDIENEN